MMGVITVVLGADHLGLGVDAAGEGRALAARLQLMPTEGAHHALGGQPSKSGIIFFE